MASAESVFRAAVQKQLLSTEKQSGLATESKGKLMKRITSQAITCILLSALMTVQTLAQTATTTSISGLVTDTQGSAILGATVKLKDKTTNQERSATTNAEGRYSFTNLDPGVYSLTVSADRFKTSVVNDIKADVTKGVSQDVTLETGGVTEQVTITASGETQLQKEDSSVGNTFDNRRVALLPNPTRDAARLVALQPGVSPDGAITGARPDQSTFTLDGIDVSDNVIGQTFKTVIPVPDDAIEEFRTTVANPNATFGRSSGAQVVFVTKRGGNQFHGSAYEYHQDNALNANSWTNNRIGLARPFLINNRFGASTGGPIFKDKTFFFVLYEGRRNISSATASRVVPTDTFKSGVLRFRDASGAIQTINPKTLDPRGIGADPAILQLLQQYPAANDFTQGDGLNTAGFVANFATPIRSDLGIARIDHQFNEKWSFDGSFKAQRQLATTNGQADIKDGKFTSTNASRPRSLSAGLVGLLTPQITNEFRFGWTRDGLDFPVISPVPQVSGLNIAANLAGDPATGGFLDEPIDVDTQRARHQARTIQVYQYIDNATWLKGTHTLQGGFNIRHFTSFDFRDDKVIGSITTPVAQLGSATFNVIPSSQRPAFVQPADVGRYNQLYGSLLGEVENITYLATRNGQLQPNPAGTGLFTNSKLNAYEMYIADTWRVKPSFNFTYGLLYEWQVPPTEAQGKQTVAVFQGTSGLVDPLKYLQQKLAAAQQGHVYAPIISYIPVNQSGRDGVFNIDRFNFSPRFAAAWSPSFKGGILGRLMGEGKTVLRGGYSLLYDRINTVQTITIPTLGVGFAQTIQTGAAVNAAGQPFRAGIDGPFPVPAFTSAKSPITPGVGGVPSEVLSFMDDPFIKVPKNHTIDFTIQRTLPGQMVLEFGYVGRLGRNLYQSINLNQVPYMFKDLQSGQTFAQAFDALATQLRSGVAASAVSPQPWFEDLLPKLNPVGGSRTRALATRAAATIINGNLSSLFAGSIDPFAAQPFDDFGQATELFYRTSAGRSNYHAFVATLRKRFSNGLAFDINYTLSRSLDQVGAVQNSAGLMPNSFFLDAEYSPSAFDRTHLFNSNWVYYLPFGRSEHLGGSAKGAVKKLISDWFVAGILRAGTGQPVSIVQGSQVWGDSILLGNNSGVIGLPGTDFSTGIHRVGSGFNLFSNPTAVLNSVRRVLLSQDTRSGRDALRGLGFWQADISVGKEVRITENMRLRFSADMINAFNHVNFNDPGTNSAGSLQNPAAFGVISSQRIDTDVYGGAGGFTPRIIQIGARFQF
jgi:hypothetical protein